MKRLGLLIAAGLLLALLPAATASGGTGGDTAVVSVVHGIGPAPSTVDVYVGPEDATEWELLIEDMEYGDLEDLGELEAGVYNILICTDEGTPAPSPIESCPEPAEESQEPVDVPQAPVNSNAGTNVEVVAGTDTTLVAAYSGPDSENQGRPTVLAFENNLDCVEAGEARVTAAHAATAPPVNVIADGTELFADLAAGEAQDDVVPAGAYDVEVVLAADDAPVLELLDTDLPELKNTVVYVVGNPQFDAAFDTIGVEIDLEQCPADQPAPVEAPVAPLSPAAAAAVRTPAFTG